MGSLTFVSGEAAFKVAVTGLGRDVVTTSMPTTTTSSDNIIGVIAPAVLCKVHEPAASEFRLGVLGLASKLYGPRSDGVLTLRVESALERQIINLVPSETPAIVGASVDLSVSRASAVLSQLGQIIASITCGAIEADGAEMESIAVAEADACSQVRSRRRCCMPSVCYDTHGHGLVASDQSCSACF